MRLPWLIAEDIPSRLIHPKRREADGSIRQRIEEELGKVVAAAGFGNPQRIVRAAIGTNQIAVQAGIVAIDIRADQINGRGEGTPQSDELLDGTAARILNSRNRHLSLWKLCGGIADPDVDVERNCKLLLACRCDFINVLRLVINLENFIGIRAEDLAPGSGLLVRRR